MGMMVTARKLSEDHEHVTYEFGYDRRFDRRLVIDKSDVTARAEDGDFDPAAGAITTKIKAAWRQHGVFPEGAVFSS
jgi:hypothetical protein